MNESKMREEYEAWVLSEYPNQNMGKFSDGEYHSNTIQYCWLAWQASRKALVIELPKVWQTNVGGMLTPNGVRFAIESAGLKVSQ